MPLLHFTNIPQRYSKPRAGTVQQQDTGHQAGRTAFPAGYRPQTYSGFPLSTPPLFPIPSPLLSARAPAFHFPFTVSNLTSPLSAFRLFLCSAPFLPLSCLQPYSRSTDYLFYFCPINSSGMVPGGKPTATKPPAIDTSHTDSLLSFQHPVL